MNDLIEIASLIVGIAVACFVGIMEGGVFFGVFAWFFTDYIGGQLYERFKNRDFIDATDELRQPAFQTYLQQNDLHPTIRSLVLIWQKYNELNEQTA